MNRPRRRFVIAAALMATALAAGDASAVTTWADPQSRTLTLAGDTSGYVDVDFHENVTPTSFHARPSVGGSYAGFLVQRLSDGKVVHGEVWVPAMHTMFAERDGVYAGGAGAGYGMVPIVGEFDTHGYSTASRYRFYLLADGPAEVVIDVRHASTARTLRVSRRRPALARVIDMGGLPGGERRVGFTASATTYAVVAAAWAHREFGLHFLAPCIEPRGASCASGGWAYGYGMQEPESYWPGERFPAGSYDAIMIARGIDVEGRGMGFFLAIDVAV